MCSFLNKVFALAFLIVLILSVYKRNFDFLIESLKYVLK